MPNRLAAASSPYLLQHANNPVDWFPWGPEALEKARRENKLMIVSIGYAACHWCHVMEHESFEDEEVAELMNEHFVCIKVDREERPDIDKVYMDAVQLITGRGGWPLNAFALPNGKPLHGGTYFRKDQWIQTLRQVLGFWNQQPDKAQEYAAHLVETMQRLQVEITPNPADYTTAEWATALNTWHDQLDTKWGGRKSKANKFPLPQNLITLLRSGFLAQRPELTEAADTTLEKMAFGGIYDHLGGGFARYSVDEFWKVPHFEKMLYDNGQLLSAYAEAYRLTRRPRYLRVMEETIGFLQRELMHPGGGFYSSLDADSEGEEGKFYTWAYDEIETLLGPDARLFCDFYNAHPFGNWEGSNILFLLEEEEDFAARWGLDPDDFSSGMARGRHLLFEARKSRIRPGLDDKILCSWNALTIRGLVDAFRATDTPDFLALAEKNARFLLANLRQEGRLLRNWKNGVASIPAFLDDYAYLADALVALYQVTFDKHWLDEAASLVEVAFDQFADDASPLFFYTSRDGEQLVSRKMETQDDVTPSSNAIMALNLHSLGLLLGRADWQERSRDMLLALKQDILAHPAWHACWGQLLLRELVPFFEVVVTGPGALDLRASLDNPYLPQVIFAGGNEENLPLLKGRTGGPATIYVCEGHTCQLPVHRVEEAWAQLGWKGVGE